MHNQSRTGGNFQPATRHTFQPVCHINLTILANNLVISSRHTYRYPFLTGIQHHNDVIPRIATRFSFQTKSNDIVLLYGQNSRCWRTLSASPIRKAGCALRMAINPFT